MERTVVDEEIVVRMRELAEVARLNDSDKLDEFSSSLSQREIQSEHCMNALSAAYANLGDWEASLAVAMTSTMLLGRSEVFENRLSVWLEERKLSNFTSLVRS